MTGRLGPWLGLTMMAAILAAKPADAGTPATIDYYRLVPGFVGETYNEGGMNTGFVAPNPWGQYTAYLMATNARGQRTWRIEHYLPNADGKTAQGSTMYLLEGSRRALLIDTANPATAMPGVNDLKTVVRHLLGHENDGRVRARPLDFVVANTHSHGDHVGENRQMSDRTVYYMDLDWPRTAPANYVPIREGGGPTANGAGMAVDRIELGDRTLTAIAIPPHTPGSTGYLDADNQMLFTGDAIGTGYVWLQWANLTIYQRSTRHLYDIARRYPRLAVFGAHFYQYKQGARGRPPINGRPADLAYIRDERDLVDAILAGKADGVPYQNAPSTFIATLGSAQIVYALGRLYGADEKRLANYHAARIGPVTDIPSLAGLKADLYLVRGPAMEAIYLLKGSRRALLIGTGSGAPGLTAVVRRLAGNLPLDVVLTSADSDQTGGLTQLRAARVFAPPGAAPGAQPLADTTVIDLGLDRAGRPLRPQARRFGDGRQWTLIEPTNRLLFSGDALGRPDAAGAWRLAEGVGVYRAALAAWRQATEGRYAIVYPAHSLDYYGAPTLVDQAVRAAADARGDALQFSTPAARR